MPVVGYCRNLHTNLCPCFVCCKQFSLDNGVEDLLTHICFTHRVVIENIERIADFQKYMDHYVQRYREAPLESFTKLFTIEVPEKDAAPREQKYYLLGDFLPEDEALRKDLHSKRLKEAQKQQKQDLSSRYNYVRHCFYCHHTLEVTNTHWVNHLRSHGFQLGNPEKLVYIERFIESIEDTFRNLHCLYCDTEFESCRALINHMEEKNHLKIHPNNRFYDQFYMINYVEFGKTWLDFAKGNKSEDEPRTVKADDDPEWSSWGTEPEYIMCLLCKHMCKSWDGTLLHMQVCHNFDFKSEVSHLNFYLQVKVVNYIRRQIMDNKCINCDHQSEDIVSHIENSNHLKIPDKGSWDHPEYFFSSLENDMFLCHLEDDEENEENHNGKEENVKEFDKKTDILQKVDVEHSESESGKISLGDEANSDRNLEAASSIGEFDGDLEGITDDVEKSNFEGRQVEITSHKKETIAENQKIESSCKDKELCSAALVGAGDSAQKILTTEKPVMVKQIHEFGDS